MPAAFQAIQNSTPQSAAASDPDLPALTVNTGKKLRTLHMSKSSPALDNIAGNFPPVPSIQTKVVPEDDDSMGTDHILSPNLDEASSLSDQESEFDGTHSNGRAVHESVGLGIAQTTALASGPSRDLPSRAPSITTNHTSNSTVADGEILTSRRSASLVRSSMELKNPDRSSPRDRYGFRKQSTYITEQQYDEWWKSYEPYVQRRKNKWVKFMKESGLYNEDEDNPVRFPPKSEKLKRYVRKGVPAEWRGNAWFWFVKGHEQISSHPGLYDKLCKQTHQLKNNDTELIERDLQRTFPDNIYFRGTNHEDTPLIEALRRVLTCFAVYMPKIGYCQSLNFLAGMLLLFMDEEKAFWMLVIITQRYLPRVHEVNLEGVNIEQGVLMLCMKEALPHLWDKLAVNFDGEHYDNLLSKLPPITLFTGPWFMSAFIGILPVETMLRVWDGFFFEDSKILYRVSLTILKLCEPQIAHIRDQMEMFQAIQNFPKKLIDASGLMEQCFKRSNGFGHISQQEIVRLREFVSDRRQKHHLAQMRVQQRQDSVSVYDVSNSTYNGVLSGARVDSTPDLSTTDLEEFKKLKASIAPKRITLARRMKSLKRSK
ncbi:GTPase-activating protein GYP3 [Trichomonascus vanleenenianus]|uniref:Rab GTPase-activating protein MSB4 n=1 Tax=Trichomonascus vanleenenianus TaxID=2268995 RepID=UPI003ECA8AB6